MSTLSPEEPVCFVSSHLDDVALSCSHYLADHQGTKVVTVMAGAPKIHPHGEWNSRTTGRSYAPDAIQVRKDEDTAAMRMLGADPIWLELWDRSYLNGKSHGEYSIARELRPILMRDKAKSIVAPIGIRHSDHVAVSNACLRVARELQIELYYYSDMPYALEYPEEVKRRLDELSNSGLDIRQLDPIIPISDVKKRVFSLYKSQCKAIRRNYATFKESMSAAEQYWQVFVK